MRQALPKTDAELHPVRMGNYQLVVAYLGGALGLAAEKMGLPPQLLFAYRRGRKDFAAADARLAEVSLGLTPGWMDEPHQVLDPVPDVLRPLKDYKRDIYNRRDWGRPRQLAPEEDVALHGVRMANFELVVNYMGGAQVLATQFLGLRYSRMARYRNNEAYFETQEARTAESRLGCEPGWMDEARMALDPVPEALRPYENHKRIQQLRPQRDKNEKDAYRASRLRLLFPRGQPRSYLICGALGLSPHMVGRVFSSMPEHIAHQLEDELGLVRGWFDKPESPTERELAQAGDVTCLVERALDRRFERMEAGRSVEARALIARIAEMDSKGILSPELAADVTGRLMRAGA